MTNRIISGMQVTGFMHIGNYFGAMQQWLKLQNSNECYFFLADLHALTTEKSRNELNNNILSSAALYIACGIDIKKSTIFIQSEINEHAELAWLLNCITPIGKLKRMTQYKEKSVKDKEYSNLGLLAYPVLMASDILLYQADLVPTGDDQKQHIELTRDIAITANKKFNEEFFKLPEPHINNVTQRIMSLKDPTKKMSKSDWSDYSRINLNDNEEAIIAKIRRATTDSIEGISYDPINRPGISNLLNIYSAVSGKAVDKIVKNYKNKNFKEFKDDLTNNLLKVILPISNNYNKLMNDKPYLLSILNEGKEKASVIANDTISKFKNLLGLVDTSKM